MKRLQHPFARQAAYIGDAGLIWGMTDGECRLLLLHNDCLRGHSHEYERSREFWMRGSGLSSDGVCRAERGLSDELRQGRPIGKGIITILARGLGRGNVTRYRYNPVLAQPFLTTALEHLAQQKADWESRKKGDRRSQKRAMQSRKKADAQSPKGRSAVAARGRSKEREREREETTTERVVVEVALDDRSRANREALIAVGLSGQYGDLLDELAARQNVTPAVINRLANDRDAANVGNGLLVHAIRAWPQLIIQVPRTGADNRRVERDRSRYAIDPDLPIIAVQPEGGGVR